MKYHSLLPETAPIWSLIVLLYIFYWFAVLEVRMYGWQ